LIQIKSKSLLHHDLGRPTYCDATSRANAFNGNPDACPASANCKVSAIVPDKNFAWIASMVLFLHF